MMARLLYFSVSVLLFGPCAIQAQGPSYPGGSGGVQGGGGQLGPHNLSEPTCLVLRGKVVCGADEPIKCAGKCKPPWTCSGGGFINGKDAGQVPEWVQAKPGIPGSEYKSRKAYECVIGVHCDCVSTGMLVVCKPRVSWSRGEVSYPFPDPVKACVGKVFPPKEEDLDDNLASKSEPDETYSRYGGYTNGP